MFDGGQRMVDEIREIRSAADVDEAMLADAGEVFDGWWANESRIDWEAFIDRLSDHYGAHAQPPYEFLDYDSPAVRKIQRHVRRG